MSAPFSASETGPSSKAGPMHATPLQVVVSVGLTVSMMMLRDLIGDSTLPALSVARHFSSVVESTSIGPV